jgi:hypothetical protein
MKQLRPTLFSYTATLLLLVICSTTAVSQNQKPGADIERLAQQLQAVEARAKEISSSSAEMQQAYGNALSALRAAFDAAVEKESRQINDLLRIITEQEARKPLEDYLACLRQMRSKKDGAESVVEPAGAPPRSLRQSSDGRKTPTRTEAVEKMAALGNGGDGDAKRPVDTITTPAPSDAGKATIGGVVTLADLSLEDRDKTTLTVALKNDKPQRASIQTQADKDFRFNFEFQPVPPGKYTITYEADGWSKVEESIQVGAGERLRLRGSLRKASGSVAVIVRDSGRGDPVKDAHVKLLYLSSGGGSPNFAPSSEAFVLTDSAGVAKVPIPDKTKTYKVIVQKNGYIAYVQEDAFTLAGNPLELNVELVPQGIDYHRAIVGIEQSGASGAKSSQNLFLNLFFYRPLLRKNWDEKYDPTKYETDKRKDRTKETPKLGVWGDIRLTSTPQRSQNLFQSFGASLNDTLKDSVNGLTDLKTAVSFMVGPQLRIWGGYLGGHWFTLSAVAGGGALAPFSAEDQVDTFSIPRMDTDGVRFNALADRLEDLIRRDQTSESLRKLTRDKLVEILKMNDNISFVPQDRNRFLRNFFGGARMQLSFNDVLPVKQTATFDVLLGWDEAVTGGKMDGKVLRFDGFFPLPLTQSGVVYLFGSASLGFGSAIYSDPLLLARPSSAVQPTSEKTFVFPLSPANRDLYRVGIGINLVGARLK